MLPRSTAGCLSASPWDEAAVEVGPRREARHEAEDLPVLALRPPHHLQRRPAQPQRRVRRRVGSQNLRNVLKMKNRIIIPYLHLTSDIVCVTRHEGRHSPGDLHPDRGCSKHTECYTVSTVECYLVSTVEYWSVSSVECYLVSTVECHLVSTVECYSVLWSVT